MEIKKEKSERASEISYLQLQNSNNTQLQDETKFEIKQTFLKHLIKVKGIVNQEGHDDPINYESDQGFLNELFQITEKHSIAAVAQQKSTCDDETCEKIHQICAKHYQANKFNSFSDYQPSQVPKQNKCKCGCGKAEGDPLPIWTDQYKHYFFGPIIILYFFFLRKILTLLIIIVLVYVLYAVTTNIMLAPSNITELCAQNPGMLSFLCPLKYLVTTLNKLDDEKYMRVQVWLGFLFCTIWILALRIIRSMGRILNKKIDDNLDSSSDYVIQIYNLPIGKYTETEILKYLTSLWKGFKGGNVKPLSIKSVQIIYRMDEARQMLKKIISNAKKLVQNLVKQEKQGKTLYRIKDGQLETYMNSKIELIRSMVQIQQYRERFVNDQQFREQLASDIALVQFSEADDQINFLKQVKQYRLTILGQLKQIVMNKICNNDQNYVFKGNTVRITRAPQPSDINWLNCEKKNSLKLLALVWMIAFTMICISFGFLTLIRYLRQQFQVLRSLSILVSISLQAFNRIIWNTLVSTISLQQNNTSTDNVMSTLNKGAFAQVVNVIVLPVVFNYAMRNNLVGPEGMIGSTIDYHFTFFFMQIFLNFINVPYQLKRLSIRIPFIRKYVIRKYSLVTDNRINSSQQIKQVLSYYEPPAFNVASNFISLNTIIFQTMFFVHMQPALIMCLIINIMTIYMIQKYLLLRRCKIPQLFDFIIFQSACSYLQHVPLVYALGSIMFMQILGSGNGTVGFTTNYIPSLLCILVWLIFMMNPFSVLNRANKYIASFMKFSDGETNSKQQQMSNQKMSSSASEQLNQDDVVFKRKQCYYSKCGTNQLLQYEATLTEVKKTDQYESQNKLFCQKFSTKAHVSGVNMAESVAPQGNQKNRRNTRKMLPRIKQSFALIQDRKPMNNLGANSGKNNKIKPIDVYTYNEKNMVEAFSGSQNEKQNYQGYTLKYNKGRRRAKQQVDEEPTGNRITKNRLILKSLNKD